MPRVTMQSIQNDIKQVDQKVDFLSYKQKELAEKVDKTNTLLQGDRENHIEGIIDKVERHEDIFDKAKDFPFTEVKNMVTNWNFVKAGITTIGIGNAIFIIKSLIESVGAK